MPEKYRNMHAYVQYIHKNLYHFFSSHLRAGRCPTLQAAVTVCTPDLGILHCGEDPTDDTQLNLTWDNDE
jgi:hypothetical protein